jgi:hypothetical protein
MKIVLVHYHLKTGGVTTVLKQQIAALHGVGETLVLTGDRARAALPCPVVEIAELGYDRPDRADVPEIVAAKVLAAIDAHWPGGCDVVHVHNPTLAKNRQFLKTIKRLQGAGVPLFLQIHDFAEEGRPGAYFGDAYPEDAHYGVINSRDGRYLIAAGLDPAGVHHLPNAVMPLPVEPGLAPDPLVLYPVRAIRRKNLGEAILLAQFFKAGHRLAITQPPNSAADMGAYRAWKQFATGQGLNVDFEQGRSRDFATLVGAAQAIVATSIAEGFGFAFLEPWTAAKMLWGRRLPAPCEDFTGEGIDLSSLYDRINVRLAWCDAAAFRDQWRSAVFAGAQAYGFIVNPGDVDAAFARMTREGLVDFGLLSERFQRQVIVRLLSDSTVRDELTALNPWLADVGAAGDASALIAANREVVARRFGLDNYRERLLAIYARVVRHPVRHRIDKKALWRSFFDLDRFSLLQWGAPPRDAYDV